MYRPYLHRQKRQEQALELLKKGQFHQLSLAAQSTNLSPFARIIGGQAAYLAVDLKKKQNRSKLEQVMLIVALMVSDQDHFEQMAELNRQYPGHLMADSISELINGLKLAPTKSLPAESKVDVQQNFKNMVIKANFKKYFNIPGVPVFLISTNWISRLFSPDDVHPPAIDNQHLVTPTDYPLASQEHMHLNYAVRQTVQEKVNFQMLPYDAWKYIHGLYGGLQVKRFVNQGQKNPTVQIWALKITLILTQERCIINKMTLLASRCETMEYFLKRVMKIVKRYRIVTDVMAMGRTNFYKAEDMTQKEVKARLHDDEIDHLPSSHFYRVNDMSTLMRDIDLLFGSDCLILNFEGKGKLFEGLKPVQLLGTRKGMKMGM